MIKIDFLNKILKWGMYAIPLTVLLYYQRTIYPFLALKVFVFEVLVAILLIVWVVLVLSRPESRPKFSLLNKAILIFLALYTTSSLLGVDLTRSFWGAQSRGLGLISLYCFYVCYLILITIRPKLNWPTYLRYLSVTATIVAITAIVQRVFPSPFFVMEGSRPGGTLGNPAYLASYLVIAIFLAGWLTYQAWQDRRLGGKILHDWRILLVETAILITGLFLSNTRGAILGFLVGVGVLLVYSAIRKFQPFSWSGSVWKNPALLLIVMGIMLTGTVLATPQAKIWQPIPGLNRLATVFSSDSAISNRLSTWKIAVNSFTDKPILGWGLENFKYGFDQNYDPALFRSGFSDTYFDKPHNVFLEMLSTGGVIGFASYIGLLLVVLYSIKRVENSDQRWFLVAMLIAYLVQDSFIFDTFGSYLLLFISLAYIDSLIVDTKRSATQADPVKLKWPAFTGILLLVLGSSGYVTMVSAKTFYANRLQYETLNYFASYVHDFNTASGRGEPTDPLESLLKDAFSTYQAGADIKQPYFTDFRHNFLTALSDTIQQAGIGSPRGMIDRALFDYEGAITSEPMDYFNFVTRADAKTVFYRFNPKYLEGAQADLDQAEVLSPNRQQTRFVVAKVLLLKGKTNEAFEEMRKAVELDPLSGDPHFYFGLLAFQVGDLETGFREIDSAKELGREPRNAREYRQLGNTYGDAERYERAREYYQAAIGLEPDDLDTRMKLGIVAYYTGENELAKEQFEYVLPKVPLFKNSANYQELKPIFDQLGVKE